MRSVCTLVLLVVSLHRVPLGAQAPPSRADEHAKKQEEKAAVVAPYRPNRIEKQVLAIEKAGGFTAARGFFVAFGNIKSGSGPALGPGYARELENGAIWHAKAVYSVRSFKLAQFGIDGPPLLAGRLRTKARVRWQDAPVLRVHALGANSSQVRGDYSETMTEASGEASFAASYLRVGAGSGLEAYKTAPGDSDRPPIEKLFGHLPGLYADPEYVHSFASLAADSRDAPGYSRRGSFFGVAAHDYRQQGDGPYSFRRFDAAAEQYVPILHGNWVLFFSAHASTTSVHDGDIVPFFLMPALGGGRSLRGYHTYRFRDRHSVNFTGEYRWYAQEFLDVALFYDAGKVAASRSALDFSDLSSDAGIGIRLHGPRTTAVRIELARGQEGFHLVFAFSSAGR